MNIYFSCVLLLISSCSIGKNISSESPGEKNDLPELAIEYEDLLSSGDCSAPCFWNITPGITSKDDAIEILSQKGDLEKCEKWNKVPNGANEGIGCNNLGITFNENGIVSSIVFDNFPSLNVSDLINKYGNPDKVAVITNEIQSQEPVSMLLLFDNKQMVVGLHDQDMYPYNLQSTTKIESILFCELNVYINFTNSYDSQWHDFGDYQ